METKICNHCKKEQIIQNFVFRKDENKYRNICKSCYYIQQKYNHLKRNYNITKEEYLELLKNQNNKCAICNKILDNSLYTHLDHCHKSNIIRGILCNNCNHGLGKFKDSIQILKSAIKYLEEYNG